MTELNELESIVLQVFRVTGFFNKTPKKDVARSYVGVVRGLQADSVNTTVEDVGDALKSLADKGLLRIDKEKSTAYLTDEGYAVICS